jgi:hypothetical protein
MPIEFSSLTKLEVLDLRNSSFVGLLPPDLSNLRRTLQAILLDDNGFSGKIPLDWGALTQLNRLGLGRSLDV